VTNGEDPPQPVPGTHAPEPQERGYQGGAEFYMNFAEVQGLTKLLFEAEEHCKNIGKYVQEPKNAWLEGDGDGLSELHGNHDAFVEQAESWFIKAADPVLETSATKIETAIQRFMKTETDNAAAIDAHVPARIDTVDVSLPPWDKSQTPIENTDVGKITPYGPFQWVDDPDDALRDPSDYRDDPGLAFHPKVYDILGPSAASAARSIVVEVTGFIASMGLGLDRAYDPYEVFTKPIVGDWAGLRRYADVLRYAGDAAERTGIGIDRARHMLEPVWKGRAADACVVWLGAVAKPLRDAPNGLDAMADAYQRAAEGAANYRTLIDDTLNAVIDHAVFIAGAVAIGAGGAAATGGLSAGLATVVAGAEIILLVQAITKLFDCLGKIDTIKAGLAVAQNDFGSGQARGPQMPNLPTVSGGSSALSVLPS
jgi:hypothetical protein